MIAVTKAGVATELDDLSNAPSIPSRHGRQRAATRPSKSEEVQRAAEHAPSHENETIRE